MFIKRLAFFIILAGLTCAAYADLGDFKDKVEQTEKEHENQPEPDHNQAANNGGSTDSSGGIGGLFFSIFKLIWLLNNTTTTFGDYPYAEGGYICWARAIGSGNGDLSDYEPTGKRNQWFQVGAQGIWMKGIGFGDWVSFKACLYRFFGLYLEDWTIIDGTNSLNGLRLGMSLSLFQSDPFSMSLYSQWNLWSGILDRNGAVLGLEFDSYPVKPLTLHARLGIQLFSSFNLGEFEAQLGFMLGPVEVFAGWRYWNLVSGGSTGNYEFNGAFSGVRYHF